MVWDLYLWVSICNLLFCQFITFLSLFGTTTIYSPTLVQADGSIPEYKNQYLPHYLLASAEAPLATLTKEQDI